MPPDSGPTKPDYAARLAWERSLPVTLSPAHPARKWAARRNLWRPGDPFPAALRWLAHPGGGGSIVAAFAPIPGWRAAHPPNPSGVQLVHVDPDGASRKDRGGLSKRSRGSMSGAVCVIGDPLRSAGIVHVAEGLADALAIAAREDGAALAVGGTAGFGRLAEPLARIGAPVRVWPDGDAPGRIVASRLVLALQARGAVASAASVPDGFDPAELAGPFTPTERRNP